MHQGRRRPVPRSRSYMACLLHELVNQQDVGGQAPARVCERCTGQETIGAGVLHNVSKFGGLEKEVERHGGLCGQGDRPEAECEVNTRGKKQGDNVAGNGTFHDAGQAACVRKEVRIGELILTVEHGHAAWMADNRLEQ